VGSRAGLDAMAKSKILDSARESNLGRPARNLFTILTEISRLSTVPDFLQIVFSYNRDVGIRKATLKEELII
jgi:hypothetical protein